MKILVTGDRHWTDKELIVSALLEGISLWKSMHPGGADDEQITVVHGAARGADRLAGEVAAERGWEVDPHPAKWRLYRKGAGPIRNAEMLTTNPDFVVAFHDDFEHSTGTRDMVNRADDAGLLIIRVAHLDSGGEW